MAVTSFTFSYHFRQQVITVAGAVNAPDRRIHTVIFLGTVQIGAIPRWVAHQAPPGTIVVQGAPHWLAPDPSGADIPDFMRIFTLKTMQYIARTYTLERPRLIADSQAAPGVIHALKISPYTDIYTSLGLIQPLGLTAAVFGETETKRAATFKDRILRNLVSQFVLFLTDFRYSQSMWWLIRKAPFRSQLAMAQYTSGLAHDSLPDLHTLAQRLPIVIVCGSKDRIFPPHEIKATVARLNIVVPVFSVPGITHASLATRQGSRLLHVTLDHLA